MVVAPVRMHSLISLLLVGAAGLLAGCAAGKPASIDDRGVTSVEVTPAQVSLVVGDTARFRAVPRTNSGEPIAGCAITWASSSSSVADVDGSGLATAVGAGNARISASCEGVTGDAGVAVTTSSAPSVDTVFYDSFETGALNDANRWQDIIGSFSIVTAATEGITAPTGARVMKVQPSGGAISHFVATTTSSPYEQLRLSYRMYRLAGYASGGLRSGHIRGSRTQWGSYGIGGSCPDDPNNAQKQEFFITALAQPSAEGWALRMYNYWLGQQKAQASPPVCYGTYALGPGDTPQGTYYELSFAPSENRWYGYEIELRLNTAGVADGWEKVWVDGVLKMEHTNVKYRNDPLTRIWAVTFDVGNTTVGTAYFDDVLVTVTRAP